MNFNVITSITFAIKVVFIIFEATITGKKLFLELNKVFIFFSNAQTIFCFPK